MHSPPNDFFAQGAFLIKEGLFALSFSRSTFNQDYDFDDINRTFKIKIGANFSRAFFYFISRALFHLLIR